MNNHITASCYGTSTDKFDRNVFKCSYKNEHVAKKPCFKVYAFMTVNNENKLCYECNGTRTHNHLVHKRTLNHLAKLVT